MEPCADLKNHILTTGNVLFSPLPCAKTEMLRALFFAQKSVEWLEMNSSECNKLPAPSDDRGMVLLINTGIICPFPTHPQERNRKKSLSNR